MNQNFEALQVYLDKHAALQTAMVLLEWDNETLAPEEAIEKTSKMIGILSEEAYRCFVNDDVKKLMKKLAQAEDLTEKEAAIVKTLRKELDKLEKISPEEQRAYSELVSRGQMAWQKAKADNNFDAFAPYLEKTVETLKRWNGYQKKEGQKLYDVSLYEYEEGFGIQELDVFFGKLKEVIVPLLAKVQQSRAQIDTEFVFCQYDVEKQKVFNQWLAGYLGFDFKKGVIAESEHPFTTNLHNSDVRITTHYYPDNLLSAIFSTIHETGHALYEMHVPDELTQTPVGGGASCGMHESQSRMYENMIGRSREFWEPIFGRLKETFPEQLREVDLDAFVRAANSVKADLIRTESDELTYCLHIMVRYEAEKKLFEEDYPVKNLPKLWNTLYQEYLGIEPKDNREGVLQDVHWAGGMFGYFPSYALGNAFAAQIYHTMSEQMDVSALLRSGQLNRIADWLRDNVHKYGASKNAAEILKLATGEAFNPDYYIQYLEEKYTALYQLD